MRSETKSVVKIGLNNDKQMVVDVDFNMFESVEDIEPLYLIIGAMADIKNRLLDIVNDIREDNDDSELYDNESDTNFFE